jgi:hypothetical protein
VALAQRLDQATHLYDLGRVEADRRFVEDEHIRVVKHGLGQSHALAQPLGELADVAFRPVQQVHVLQDIVDALPEPVDAANAADKGEVTFYRHLRVKRHCLRQVAQPPARCH